MADRQRKFQSGMADYSRAQRQATVSSGLAVAVLSQTIMPLHARLLTAEEGFSNLPGSGVVLRKARRAASPVVSGMAAAIGDAFRAAGA